MADSAARAVERRPETLFSRFDFREIVEAEPELLEVAAADSRQRISRQRPGRLAGDLDANHREGQTGGQCGESLHYGCSSSSTIISPRMKLCPAPHTFEHSKVYRPGVSARKIN